MGHEMIRKALAVIVAPMTAVVVVELRQEIAQGARHAIGTGKRVIREKLDAARKS